MDVVTYALLKKKIDEIVSGYVTDEEMTEAISTAVADLVSTSEMTQAISLATQNLVTTGQMTVAIDNAVANRVTTSQMTTAINNAVADLVSDTEMANAIATATADFLTETEINSLILNSVGAIIAGFSYKGTVATISALPTGAAQGDCYTVDENLGTYVWDGTKWFEYNINLNLILQEGTEETAQYHLGFYIDSDGDLNQLDN